MTNITRSEIISVIDAYHNPDMGPATAISIVQDATGACYDDAVAIVDAIVTTADVVAEKPQPPKPQDYFDIHSSGDEFGDWKGNEDIQNHSR